MSSAGPLFPKFPDIIVRIYTLMIYSDIVEYNIKGDKKLLFHDAFRLYRKLTMETSSQRDKTWIIKIFQNCYLRNSKKLIPQLKIRAPGLLWWKSSFQFCWSNKSSTNV